MALNSPIIILVIAIKIFGVIAKPYQSITPSSDNQKQ
jgi:hypothetical protein